MALMSSQQPEGAVRDQKHSTMAALAEDQPKVEVNGHTDPKPELDTNQKMDVEPPKEKPEVSEPLAVNHASNDEALTSDQPLPAKPAPESSDPPAAPGSDEPAAEAAAPDAAPKEDDAPACNADMTDAPDQVAPSEPRPEPQEKPAAETTVAEPSEAAAEPEPEPEPAAPAAEAPAEPMAEPAAKPMPGAEPVPPESKEDVVMEDAQQESKPGDRADQPDGTQKTTVTETPVAPPAEEVSPRATADTSQELLSTSSATTDTSMTDAPSKPPLKLVREREDDNEEEPAAKRAKTESDGEEIRVEPKPDVADAGADESAIDESAIDDSVIAQPARSAGPVVPTHDSEGRVKYLNDPSLDRNPITPYQNREIRRALALVKKTKNGMVFKDPVSKAWPQLWESYIAKVEHPTDISTIERKLRETDLTGSFATLGDFKREVRLMEHNSMVFNGEAHAVTAQAKSVVDQVMERIAAIPAEEAARSDKKEPKQQPTRHAEPRAVTQQRRPSRGAATSPVEKMVDNVVAVPASGVPVIRRQSTKNDEDRPKRPIHPPKNKDLEYEPKNFKKQKLSPDFRFCDEVLTELKKKKYDFNQFFLYPVDPILHGVPTYWSVIKKPMDLETMTGKLHRGEYKKTKDFENDFLQIVRNCVKFNGDANPVTHQVHQLEALFKEKWAERDEWIANHAPPAAAASATSSHSGGADGKDEEDEEDAAEDQGGDDQVKQARALIDGLNARLTEETEKLTKMLTTSDMISVQVQRGMVTTLQDEIIKASQKLTEVEKQQPKPAKPKAAAAAASKRKSTGAAGAGAAGAGGSKKAGGGSGGSGSAGGKKGGGGGGGGAKKAPKARVIGQAEKDIIAEGINDLDGAVLEQAIDIIKKDTNQTENDTGELELDIEQLSMPALIKLYDIIVKTFPHLRKNEPEPAHEPTAPARDRPKASKSKKNKPMNKVEQERKIAQLREVQAAFARPGSGSQEPVPSVEDAAGQDSDDEEEDSEEE